MPEFGQLQEECIVHAYARTKEGKLYSSKECKLSASQHRRHHREPSHGTNHEYSRHLRHTHPAVVSMARGHITAGHNASRQPQNQLGRPPRSQAKSWQLNRHSRKSTGWGCAQLVPYQAVKAQWRDGNNPSWVAGGNKPPRSPPGGQQ